LFRITKVDFIIGKLLQAFRDYPLFIMKTDINSFENMNYSKIFKNKLSSVQKQHVRGLKSSIWGIRRYFKNDYSLPNFLVVGAQRGGTSSLYFLLLQHPSVVSAAVKEIHYFDNPIIRRRGENWYRSQFPSISYMSRLSEKLGDDVITGEATPFMYSFHSPRLVKQTVPNAKIIILLRDPIERAISHYSLNKQFHGRELLTIEDAFLNEKHRIQDEYEKSVLDENFDDKKNRCYSYLSRGGYDEQIERWYTFFDKDQILLIDSIDLFKDPNSTLKEVTGFLGISQDFTFDTSVKLNFGNQKEKVSDELIQYLTTIYKPHNDRLEQITGRKFSWIS
jgi:hypothetical protein